MLTDQKMAFLGFMVMTLIQKQFGTFYDDYVYIALQRHL